jgi:ATP-dependent DNA ligase
LPAFLASRGLPPEHLGLVLGTAVRLVTCRGNDWTQRYPLVVEAVNHLKVRACLIDGEVVRCDAQGVTSVRRLHAKIVIN